MKFGYLNNQRLEGSDLNTLADLPSIDILRGTLLGVISAPATKLVVLLNTPATQLARVLKAKADKAETAEKAEKAE
jgi:large subunit ribosomal protein L10